MLIPDKIDDLMTGLVEFKTIADEEGMEMIPPSIIVFTEDEAYTLDLADLIPDLADICESMGVSAVPVAAKAAVFTFRYHHPDARIVGLALGNEGVMVYKDPDFDVSTISRGDIERDWRENPATEAREVMLLTIVEDDLCGGYNAAVIHKTFARTDGGAISWDDTQTSTDVVQSFVIDMLRSALTEDIPPDLVEAIGIEDLS